MKRRVVHDLKVGDVEDPEIYLGFAWQGFSETEKGKWIVDNCRDLVYTQRMDAESFGYVFQISAKMSDAKWTYFLLKWGTK